MTKTKYDQGFIKFRDQLLSFVYRIVNHREEAEDIVQETYMKAVKKLDQFDHKSSHKTWTFAIAINIAKDSQRAKRRWGADWQDIGKTHNQENPHILQKRKNIPDDQPFNKFVIKEHINFCFTCINKTLPLDQQICLLLKEVYQFKIREIILITAMTEGQVKHAIANARSMLNRIFAHRCALINKKGICHQCTELNHLFNPAQNSQIEINKLSLTKSAQKENYPYLLDLRLALVRAINPLQAEGTELHNFILQNCPDWVRFQLAKNPGK